MLLICSCFVYHIYTTHQTSSYLFQICIFIICPTIRSCMMCSCGIHFLVSQLVSVLQDGAAVTGLAIAAASLVAVNTTGNAIYDPIGSIIVGNLLGMVCDLSLKELECLINVSKIFLTSMI